MGDLTCPGSFSRNQFDCIILTQVLQQIYALSRAIETLYKLLKPGGVLLATLPGITQIDRYAYERGREHWRFTALSAEALFAEQFDTSMLTVSFYGNVYAATLHGVVVEEVERERLDVNDQDYPVTVTIRAVKPMIDSVS